MLKSIQSQLLIGLSLGILLATSLAGIAIYRSASHEANQLFDYQLQQTAISLPAHVNDQAISQAEELEEDFLIQVWNRKNKLIYTSREAFSLPRYKQQGFQTIHAFDEDWRIYIENRRMNYIQVAQPLSVREALATSLATRSLAPFLVLIPVMLLLVAFIVKRSLAPLESIAQALGQRSPVDLQALPTHGLPLELSAIVRALNGWLARLDKALSAQRDFVADAAHELRSPLTALKLQLQLTERASTESQRLVGFGKLHERLNRAIHLVEQLLTLARHETTSHLAVDEQTTLGELLRIGANDYTTLASSKQIHLNAVIPSPDIPLQGNLHSLTILLKNLVENALKHTPAEGSIQLKAFMKAGQSCLQVTDTGCGIDPQDRQRVFDRFYRCPSSNAPGTGLGLAIVRNIAEQHHAHIDLAENPHGQGLQVTVCFPAMANARPPR